MATDLKDVLKDLAETLRNLPGSLSAVVQGQVTPPSSPDAPPSPMTTTGDSASRSPLSRVAFGGLGAAVKDLARSAKSLGGLAESLKAGGGFPGLMRGAAKATAQAVAGKTSSPSPASTPGVQRNPVGSSPLAGLAAAFREALKRAGAAAPTWPQAPGGRGTRQSTSSLADALKSWMAAQRSASSPAGGPSKWGWPSQRRSAPASIARGAASAFQGMASGARAGVDHAKSAAKATADSLSYSAGLLRSAVAGMNRARLASVATAVRGQAKTFARAAFAPMAHAARSALATPAGRRAAAATGAAYGYARAAAASALGSAAAGARTGLGHASNAARATHASLAFAAGLLRNTAAGRAATGAAGYAYGHARSAFGRARGATAAFAARVRSALGSSFGGGAKGRRRRRARRRAMFRKIRKSWRGFKGGFNSVVGSAMAGAVHGYRRTGSVASALGTAASAGLGALAATGPAGAVAAGVFGAGKMFALLTREMSQFAERVHDSNQNLAPWSGRLMGAEMRLALGNMGREMRMARNTETSASALTGQVDRMRSNWSEWDTTQAGVRNRLGTLGASISGEIGRSFGAAVRPLRVAMDVMDPGGKALADHGAMAAAGLLGFVGLDPDNLGKFGWGGMKAAMAGRLVRQALGQDNDDDSKYEGLNLWGNQFHDIVNGIAATGPLRKPRAVPRP